MEIITDAIHHHANTRPYKLAIAWINQKCEISKGLNYKEVSAIINQISAFLSETTGIKCGDKVALLFPNGIEFILTFLACIQTGIIPIPLKYPVNEKKFTRLFPIFNDCNPSCIISTKTLAMKEKYTIPWIEVCEQYHTESFCKPTKLPEFAFLQFTSGSISEPKGVMVSHANIIHNLKLIGTYLTSDTGNQIIASWLPHYHDMGLIGSYLANLFYGSTGYYMAPTTFMTNPNNFLQLISDTKATLIQCPNVAFEYMISQWDNRNIDLSSLHNVINAAEPIHAATLEKFYSTFAKNGFRKEALRPTYGLAEATLFVTQANTPCWSAYKNNIACGLCSDIDIRIIDQDTNLECGEGIEGEVWLNSLSNTLGYYNKPELTEKIFKAKIIGSEKHYLRTGDLGFIRDEQLYITGRVKEVIIINGINIYPHDIEYTVEQFSGSQLHGCAAFSWNDHFSTKIVVVVEIKNQIPDINDLVQFILQHHDIPLYDLILVPRFTLPKTTSGKIRRLACKNAYIEHKLTILKQWNKTNELDIILSDTSIDSDSDKTLFEIGVDSLKIAHFHCQLSQKVNSLFADELLTTRLYQMTLSEYRNIIKAKSNKEQEIIILNFLERVNKLSSNSIIQIKCDAKLQSLKNNLIQPAIEKKKIKKVLLTGGTGFIGAYLLFFLLKMTDYHIILLVRSKNEDTGLQRVLINLEKYKLLSQCETRHLKSRISIICGDLSEINLGLTELAWDQLATKIDCIYHNGASTHYLAHYKDLKSSNVDGTNTIIKLALSKRLKYIHYISTTLIFGWTPLNLIKEDHRNTSYRHVDFGYAETKWVAEQLIWQAQKMGVPIQIYRPAMVTASSDGQYTKDDIVARTITYALNHGVAVDMPNQISLMPVDKVAADIVTISLLDKPQYTAYHLVSEYANFPIICHYLTQKYNYQFTYMSLMHFNQHLQKNTSPKDLIFPLINFYSLHYKKINKMHNKRYSSKHYLTALSETSHPTKKYTLADTLDFIIQFLQQNKLIHL